MAALRSKSSLVWLLLALALLHPVFCARDIPLSNWNDLVKTNAENGNIEGAAIPVRMQWPAMKPGEKVLTKDYFSTMLDLRSCCISVDPNKPVDLQHRMYIVTGDKVVPGVGDGDNPGYGGWRMKLWRAALKDQEVMVQFDDPNISIFALANGKQVGQIRGGSYADALTRSHHDHCFVLGKYAFLGEKAIYDLEKLLAVDSGERSAKESEYLVKYDDLKDKGEKIGNVTLTADWIKQIQSKCFAKGNGDKETYCAPYLEGTRKNDTKPLWIGEGQRIVVIGDDIAYLKPVCGPNSVGNNRCYYYVVQEKPEKVTYYIPEDYYLNDETKMPDSKKTMGYRTMLYPFIRPNDQYVEKMVRPAKVPSATEAPISSKSCSCSKEIPWWIILLIVAVAVALLLVIVLCAVAVIAHIRSKKSKKPKPEEKEATVGSTMGTVSTAGNVTTVHHVRPVVDEPTMMASPAPQVSAAQSPGPSPMAKTPL